MVFLSNRIIIIFVYTLALCYSQLWSQMLPFAVAEDKQLWVPQLWMIDLCQLLNIPRLGFPLFINQEGIEKCRKDHSEIQGSGSAMAVVYKSEQLGYPQVLHKNKSDEIPAWIREWPSGFYPIKKLLREGTLLSFGDVTLSMLLLYKCMTTHLCAYGQY